MEIYRGAAERLVEIYDFDWKENERMKEACICSVEAMIANGLDSVIVFTFALLAGIFIEMLIFFVTFGMLRFYAGGAHAKNYVRCVLMYICVVCISIFITRRCIVAADIYTIIICLLSIIFSGIINYKYAARQKNLGKRGGSYRRCAFAIYLFISVFIFVSCLVYIFLNMVFFQKIVLIQAFALVAQSIALFLDREAFTNE